MLKEEAASWPALIMPTPALNVPLPVNKFPNKLRNPPFRYFASFWIDSLTPFSNKPDSLRYLTIFIISFNCPFEIINVVRLAKSKGRVLDPNIFLWIAASAVAAAAVNPNGIKTL